MRKILFVLLILLIAISIVSAKRGKKYSHKRPKEIPANWRLISFAENRNEWMSPEAVEKLIGECGKKIEEHGSHTESFFDITDFPELGKLKVPAPSPLPANCAYDANIVNPYLQNITIDNWTNKVRDLSGFPTRYYTSADGVRASTQIFNWLNGICGSKCKAEFFNHTFAQPSVILRFPGINDERVIIGAHLDSTAFPFTNNAPGADDDASGVATVIEVARVLIEGNFKPTRTLEFQFFAGEEAGLLGSQAIASDYASKGVNVYAMIQNDMDGWGNNRQAYFITDFVDTDLTTCLRQIATQIGSITFGSATCGYACSDHASYTKANYRSVFPVEGAPSNSNPNIHTSRDTLSLLTPSYAKNFIELGVAAMIRLSTA